MPLTHGSLFSGIGGFDLGFERAGIETIWQVEIDAYCRKVLARHFPNAKRYDDVRTVGKHNLAPIDIISGGFPCQDISIAGKRSGIGAQRSGLWKEYSRIICELRPRIVVVENSAELVNSGMGDVLADLSEAGFDAEWQIIRASQFGASHARSRVYLVAYANGKYGSPRLGNLENWKAKIFTGDYPERPEIWLQTADRFIGMDNGLPFGVYGNRGVGIGNSVLPQITEWIGQRIIAFEFGRTGLCS